MQYFIQAQALVFVRFTREQVIILIDAAGKHEDDEVAGAAPLLEHKLQMGQLDGTARFEIREIGLMMQALENARHYEAIALYESLATIYQQTMDFMPTLNEKLERETAKSA